jgi:hypothetical protein
MKTFKELQNQELRNKAEDRSLRIMEYVLFVGIPVLAYIWAWYLGY